MRSFVDFELRLEDKEMGAYMYELAFCCMPGSSPSDCAPSAAPFIFGIPGIGGGELGPLLVPLKRLLGGVGIFFGRSNVGAVPGRSDMSDLLRSSTSGVVFMDASLEL